MFRAVPRVAFVMTSVSVLMSQQAAAQEVTEPGQSNAGLLEVIIVTAQKRKENLQDVPVSVTVINTDQLRSLKLENATQITQQTPNLSVQTPYGENQPIFSLRGISLVDYSQHQQGPIAMYVDEDYKGAGVFRAQQLYDIDRVEVLRGPQGTLFGRNTTGGAVNIYTVDPKLHGSRGHMSGGIGNFGLVEATGALEVTPVDDVLGLRVAFDYRKTDGYFKAVQPGLSNFGNEDGFGARIKVAFQPSDTVRFNLTYSHARSDTNPVGYAAVRVGENGIGNLGYFNEGLGFYETNAGGQGYLKINNDSALLRSEFDTSSHVTLTSLTSYNHGKFSGLSDDDDRPENIVADGADTTAEVWSQEFRLASTGTGPFTWLAGASLSKEDVETATRYDYFGLSSTDIDGTPSCLIDNQSGCIYLNSFDMERQSWAAFGHLTYELTDRLQIQGGLRYSNDKTSLNDYQANLGYFDPATGAAVFGGGGVFIDGAPFDSFTNENVSGKIALFYEATPGFNVYASFSRGYRSGTFNGYAYFDPAEVNIVKPEILNAYEIGFKSEMLNRTMRLNGAMFYYDYKNQQFLELNEFGLEVLKNAPKSRIWGGELEISAMPTDSLRLAAAVGYLDAAFKELILEGQDISGNRLASTPDWTLSGAVDWTVLPSSRAAFDVHLDAAYSGFQYYGAFNTANSAQPSYWLVNGGLTKPIGETGLSITAWVKNLFNEKYNAYLLDDSVVNGALAVRGKPRTYGISARFEF